jgi:hypothetical protein
MSNAANTIGTPSGNSAGAGQTPVAVKTNNVSVSLRVNVDVSGNVDLFTVAGQAINNVVECAVSVSVAALYDSSSSAVFEFWEPSTDRGNISGSVARAGEALALDQTEGASTLPRYNTATLVSDLAAVLAGSMDASNAAPFNAYNGNDEYTTYATFGDLSLAAHAHYLFGHPAATTAIDNDAALVTYFNGNVGNSTTANIPNLLRNAIQALTDNNATGIVRQVISQDPSRAAGQDNNQLTPDLHQGLLFAAGDVIYVQVTLKEPEIIQEVGVASTQMPGNSRAGAGRTAKFPSGGAQFALRITLA